MLSTRTLVVITLLILPATVFAQESPTTEIAGRQVEVNVVKAETSQFVHLPQANFRLTTEVTHVPQRSNVLLELRNRGIRPDAEALTLVYDLNPQIKNLNALSSQQAIYLPVFVPRKQVQPFIKNGYLIELIVDPELRRQLNDHIERLQQLAPSASAIKSDAETKKKIAKTIEWFGEIKTRFRRRTGPPLRRETLLQMNEESKQFDSILSAAIENGRSLSPEEGQQIQSIFDDIQVEIRNYSQVLGDVVPTSEAFCAVTVNIQSGGRPLPVGTRVYYTFNGLFRKLPADPPFPSFGFRELGSGKTENLLFKNYQIWAARDGDPNHPITPPYQLLISENDPKALSIELSLNQETKP